MIKIIGNSSTGKTGRLLLLAKENDAIIVCKDVEHMRQRAHKYGLNGIEFISYDDYITYSKVRIYKKPIYIDNLSEFLRALDTNIESYTETYEK